MFKIPACLSYLPLESRIGTLPRPPQLETIQTIKGIADCNVDNQNRNIFFFLWKRKSQYFIPILATSNAEIFKTIVDMYNEGLFQLLIPIVYISRFYKVHKIIRTSPLSLFDMACVWQDWTVDLSRKK